jgi:hypothetical protein
MNKIHSLALDGIYAELIDTLPFTIEYLGTRCQQNIGMQENLNKTRLLEWVGPLGLFTL